MSWPVTYAGDHLDLFTSDRITRTDADRQTTTARVILERLANQPGLVLADEVGMGKTFIALAVAASVAWSDKSGRPVVVMVPPSLQDKWPRDFNVFLERCVRPATGHGRPVLRHGVATSGMQFFKYLDDPASRRPQIIFLTHGALSRSLTDPWIKLAILKQAFRAPSLSEQWRVFPRFAGQLLRTVSIRAEEDVYARLLETPVHDWRRVLTAAGMDPGDDPVPDAIERAIKPKHVDLGPLRDALAGIPIRESANLEARLKDARQALQAALKSVWGEALVEASFRSPLLILDEAHHLKNPATELASLLVAREAEEDDKVLKGPLQGRFERMLFLTATPFQLGHHELLNVLSRFAGINWKKTHIAMEQAEFSSRLGALSQALDQAQQAAVCLDDTWKRLSAEDVSVDMNHEDALDGWWAGLDGQDEERPERVRAVLAAYHETARSMDAASGALTPWVIRHLRPRNLPESSLPRRVVLPGEGIRTGSVDGTTGLEVKDEGVLPFLLAARSQTLFLRLSRTSDEEARPRATFAEGLASSYEAFLETRRMREVREAGSRLTDEEVESSVELGVLPKRLDWYLGRLEGALPDRGAYAGHPKIAPTVERAVDLWTRGEKVLVFCHYRRTGQALARHISSALEARILSLAAQAFGSDQAEADRQLDRISERFDKDSPLARRLAAFVADALSKYSSLDAAERERFGDVVRRFVRTPSFLVRHFDLASHDWASLLDQALEREDESGLSLRTKLASFAEFVARRCSPEERGEYLEALDAIQTGERRAGAGVEDANAVELQPNVRLANGETRPITRRRLMLAFNTPFFPEILIASSVLAEGVDLHLACRHVIHHDLCWNPSTLEQRTGRVDRIGAKAERVGQPIHIYLPYVAATQDEKMYRVVRDRERWFQVLMGERYQVDEAATERLARRIPLPRRAAARLAMRLEVWGDSLELAPRGGGSPPDSSP